MLVEWVSEWAGAESSITGLGGFAGQGQGRRYRCRRHAVDLDIGHRAAAAALVVACAVGQVVTGHAAPAEPRVTTAPAIRRRSAGRVRLPPARSSLAAPCIGLGLGRLRIRGTLVDAQFVGAGLQADLAIRGAAFLYLAADGLVGVRVVMGVLGRAIHVLDLVIQVWGLHSLRRMLRTGARRAASAWRR